MMKNLPWYDTKIAKYRLLERQKVARSICSNERLIEIFGLFGDGKGTIAKSCLEFIADRKFFQGIIYLDLSSIT